jgi:hypothetical protein
MQKTHTLTIDTVINGSIKTGISHLISHITDEDFWQIEMVATTLIKGYSAHILNVRHIQSEQYKYEIYVRLIIDTDPPENTMIQWAATEVDPNPAVITDQETECYKLPYRDLTYLVNQLGWTTETLRAHWMQNGRHERRNKSCQYTVYQYTV